MVWGGVWEGGLGEGCSDPVTVVPDVPSQAPFPEARGPHVPGDGRPWDQLSPLWREGREARWGAPSPLLQEKLVGKPHCTVGPRLPALEDVRVLPTRHPSHRLQLGARGPRAAGLSGQRGGVCRTEPARKLGRHRGATWRPSKRRQGAQEDGWGHRRGGG